MPNLISEDDIEREAVRILVEDLGYRSLNCFNADMNTLPDKSGRTSKEEVVLADILREKAMELNPRIPQGKILVRIAEFSKPRNRMSPIQANREIYQFILYHNETNLSEKKVFAKIEKFKLFADKILEKDEERYLP